MMGTIPPRRCRVIMFPRHMVPKLLMVACCTMAQFEVASMTVAMTARRVVVRLSATLIGTVGGSRSVVQRGLVRNKTVTTEGTPVLTITAAHGIRTSHVQPANSATTPPPTVICWPWRCFLANLSQKQCHKRTGTKLISHGSRDGRKSSGTQVICRTR